jgi:hypothetical protein
MEKYRLLYIWSRDNKKEIYFMKKIRFLGLPIILMLFWACSSGTETDSFWTYKSGVQAYRADTMEEFTEDATLIAKAGDGGHLDATGKIVKGKVYIEMPKTLDASYLTQSDDGSIPPTKSAWFFAFDVVVDSKVIGNLQFAKDIWVEGWDVEKELNQMSFRYFPNDCTVTNNSTGQWKSVTIQMETNLKAKKGWNAILSKGAYDKNADPKNATRLFTTDLSKAPADMKWVITFY